MKRVGEYLRLIISAFAQTVLCRRNRNENIGFSTEAGRHGVGQRVRRGAYTAVFQKENQRFCRIGIGKGGKGILDALRRKEEIVSFLLFKEPIQCVCACGAEVQPAVIAQCALTAQTGYVFRKEKVVEPKRGFARQHAERKRLNGHNRPPEL